MEARHYDFTSASTFETFISRLEAILRDWGVNEKKEIKPLQENDFMSLGWGYSSELLKFAEAEFLLVRHYLKCESEPPKDIINPVWQEDLIPQTMLDLMSDKNDFCYPYKFHPIARWYGIREFIILIPEHASHVASENRRRIVLSALTIAGANTKCGIPLFLQAMEPWQNYFTGFCRSGNFKTNFNMIHLKKGRNTRIFEIMVNFENQINDLGSEEVLTSVRQTYVLKNWMNTGWTREPVNLDFTGKDVIPTSELIALPLGSNFDPLSELTLVAVWPCLLKHILYKLIYNDGELDPMTATIWKATITKAENPSSLLTDHFSEFVALTKGQSSLSELLGNLIRGKQSAGPSDLSPPFIALTESRISMLSKAVIGADRSSKNEGKGQPQQADKPISIPNLMTILYYLFPDANSASEHPYRENLGGKVLSESAGQEGLEKNLDERLSKMKSAPYDGLLWRLSIVLSHVISWMGGIRSAAFVWYEFVQELRFRWENGILIPGLELNTPDFKTCLLNQKLQLLNCCISRKIEREKQTAKRNEGDWKSDEEDEFYDCNVEVSGDEEDEDSEDGGERKVKFPPWDKPVGRLMKHGELKLLETGEPLYIPYTQSPVPKTEDQVEEYAEFLLKLGSDDKGSRMRAKLMSTSLLSDMEAFKAANPGCILSDFIRWYSPRDWIEEDETDEFGQKKGHLSSRMEIPGNTWLEVWLVAQPVPASHQRRLFNDTRESEKVLDFLARKSPKEFAELLLPVMTTCVIQRLLEEPLVGELPGTSEMIPKVIKKAEMLGKIGQVDGKRYEELINDISTIEIQITCASFLKHKFTFPIEVDGLEYEKTNDSLLMDFIKGLINGDEAEVPGGPKSEIGYKICCYLSLAQMSNTSQFPDMEQLRPEMINPWALFQEREVILRQMTDQGPQMCHLIHRKSEYRICGAFTENVYNKYFKKPQGSQFPQIGDKQ